MYSLLLGGAVRRASSAFQAEVVGGGDLFARRVREIPKNNELLLSFSCVDKSKIEIMANYSYMGNYMIRTYAENLWNSLTEVGGR